MSGTRPTVGIRVSAEGAEQARRQIEAIGPAGESAMRRVAVASAAASPEMQRLALASDVANRAFTGMGGTLGRIGATFTNVSGVAAGLTAGFAALGAAAAVGAVQIAKAGDAATATLARLTSATGGLGQAQQVYERLFALSQQTGIAVAESAGSFARFSVAAKEIGGTNDQVLKLVAGIQKAGIVAGASAQETGAAVQQLGQALASGKLQGDELRSLLENMPQLAQALARELGVGIGQLRQMGTEGKLTADVVFPALLRATEKISSEFDKMPITMSRAKDILIAATEDFGARLDRITGLSQTFARFMQQGASALRAAGSFIAPTEREAADQGVASAQDRLARVRAQAAAERAASAYGDVPAGLAQAQQIAEEELRDALARQQAILREDRELRRAGEQDAAQQAREAARTTSTIALKDLAADLDDRLKARQAYADKIKKLDELEAKGGTLPAGVTFASLRVAAEKELAEALEKTAGAHAKVAKEAADADSHVKAYLKEQEKAADAVAKAQEKAAEQIRRFHERSFDAVANIGERAFDRLGDSLVDAFVSGEGAAVNFGGVLKAVIASAVADIAKLAVVNPILNSLFTSSAGARPTLAGAFGGSATSLGGFGGFGGIGSLFGGGESLFAGASNFLFGQSAVGALGPQIPTAGLLGSGGNLFGMSGLSFGSLGSSLGMVGAGIGVGNFLGGLVANSEAQRQNAMYGSLLGTLLGGPIGGGLGGLIGGFIGPKDSVRGWSYDLRSTASTDQTGFEQGDGLRMGNVFYNDSGKAQFDQANATIAAINEYMAAAGLTVSGARAVGGNKNGPDDSWGGAASFGEALSALRFQSKTDDRLTTYLGGQSFDDPAKLQQAVEGFKQAAAAIDALGAESVPAFTASLKAINDNFDAGVEQAKKYGLAEDNLTTARAKAIATLEQQRSETLRQSSLGLEVRLLRATGQNEAADMLALTESAAAEVKAFGEAMDALAITAEDKAARLVMLENVQAAERAQIIARWGEQAASALDQNLNAGRNLLRDLAFGSSSALAPEQRYFAALSTLNAAKQDLDAGGSLAAYSQIASQVLPVARDFLGTSQRYGGLAAEVGQVLASRGADNAGLSQILSAQVGSTDALQATFAAYGEQHLPIATATLSELRRLASAIEALMARKAA